MKNMIVAIASILSIVGVSAAVLAFPPAVSSADLTSNTSIVSTIDSN